MQYIHQIKCTHCLHLYMSMIFLCDLDDLCHQAKYPPIYTHTNLPDLMSTKCTTYMVCDRILETDQNIMHEINKISMLRICNVNKYIYMHPKYFQYLNSNWSHLWSCICLSVCACISVCVCTYVYLSVCVRMSICLYVCVSLYVCCHAAVGPPLQVVSSDHLQQSWLPWMVPPGQLWLPQMVCPCRKWSPQYFSILCNFYSNAHHYWESTSK